MDGANQILLIGISATVFIALFKLAMSFVPIPGLRDLAAFV
jgi:hypothetical protein